MLDNTLNEDASRIRFLNDPENIAVKRRIGLDLLQKAKPKDCSFKGLRKGAGWRNNILSNVLREKL